MKNPFTFMDSKCLRASASVVGSTVLVAKGRAGVVSEERDEKANCLNNLKYRQEEPVLTMVISVI